MESIEFNGITSITDIYIEMIDDCLPNQNYQG